MTQEVEVLTAKFDDLGLISRTCIIEARPTCMYDSYKLSSNRHILLHTQTFYPTVCLRLYSH